jgi:hypothetical protein
VEERLMSITVKQKETELGNVIRRSTKGHLTPEVKATNEIICDYEWDKV